MRRRVGQIAKLGFAIILAGVDELNHLVSVVHAKVKVLGHFHDLTVARLGGRCHFKMAPCRKLKAYSNPSPYGSFSSLPKAISRPCKCDTRPYARAQRLWPRSFR